VVQDVRRAYPPLPAGEENRVERLRIVQVLPKTTPHANNPRMGWANASPGKQVLGTVPVERDGSAHFRAPAGIPLLFQALDRKGRSVQSMRSVTYLQAGETQSCVGCHEPRSSTPPAHRTVTALQRPPSVINPGPDGSNPFSYPLLVQPVLDKHCVACHGGPEPAGGVSLTARPEQGFTESYNRLCAYVSYSSWGRADNSEPLSQPGHFGARGSQLMRFLQPDHYKVRLTDEDLDRLITWMDTTALFYGTFNPADQERQRRGERITGPDLE
jgi:mono/diheme cytochrome c family protein